LQITTQATKVRYLSECKWSAEERSESVAYYGRDQEITLICWDNGTEVLGDS